MSDQLQELLQRVYDEGVNKAKTEAEQILAAAKSEADGILSKAKQEADSLLKAAQSKAEDLSRNTDADLKTAAQHTMSAVKQKLTDVFLENAFDEKVRAATADPEFLKKVILDIVGSWRESGGKITIAQSMEGKLDEFFLKSLQEKAGQGMAVEFSPQMKNGFSIAPTDGSFKLSFSDEDFANLFKSYLRPRTNNILFNN